MTTTTTTPVEYRVEVVTVAATPERDRRDAYVAAFTTLNEHAIAEQTASADTFAVTFANEAEVKPITRTVANAARQWAPCNIVVRKGRRIVHTDN